MEKDGSQSKRGFVVTTLLANQAIKQNRFKMPDLTFGSLVINTTRNGKSGIHTPKGIASDQISTLRSELIAKYRPQVEKKTVLVNDILIEPTTSYGQITRFQLLIVVFCMIISGIVVGYSGLKSKFFGIPRLRRNK